MSAKSPIIQIDDSLEQAGFKKIASGKVRELYELDASSLLFIATDRLSAFDVVLSNGIPDKGALLTRLSHHWFALLSDRLPSLKTHIINDDRAQLWRKLSAGTREQLESRSMIVRKLKTLPVESIVRGYITGSAWAEYTRSGTVHGIQMPAGLRESDRLETPLWTPSTKAEAGAHDENVSPQAMRELLGDKYARRVEEISLQVYNLARDYAADRGIIIADTKFEFGLDTDTDEVVLIDEVLTPDSSRFWPADSYQPGRSQASFDKQDVRDWLTREGLKGKQGVVLPDEVVERTRQKYVEAYEVLTGRKWTD